MTRTIQMDETIEVQRPVREVVAFISGFSRIEAGNGSQVPGSSKPYLLNADNVARYAPASWHSPGSVIDTSYEASKRELHRDRPRP